MDCLISWPGGPAGNSAYYPHHWQLQNPLEAQKRRRTTIRYEDHLTSVLKAFYMYTY